MLGSNAFVSFSRGNTESLSESQDVVSLPLYDGDGDWFASRVNSFTSLLVLGCISIGFLPFNKNGAVLR